jgi:uncharacterized RDD family membrane protein YckC
MSTKLCPNCGTAQQSELWRICQCGYDFGPVINRPTETTPLSVLTRRYDTFWKRFFAGWIDGLVLLPISVLDFYLLSPHRPELLLILWGCFSFSIGPVYSVMMHARFGQTVGKMVEGVKVLNLDEDRLPSIRQAFLRDIGDIVNNALSLLLFLRLVIIGRYAGLGSLGSGAGQLLSYGTFLWFLLEIVTMLTNHKRRALHDVIAGTVVVRVTRKGKES